MRLDLNDDQQLFLDTVRRFVESETPIADVRARIAADEVFDPAWWRRAAELGFSSFLVPESAGGGSISGQGPVDLVIIAEILGRGVVPTPFLPVNVVADALGRADSDAHADVLAGLLDGSNIAAWVEDPRGAAPTPPPVTAARTGSSFVLDGEVTAVEAADQATHLLVSAVTEDGDAQFLLPSNTDGVTIERQQGLDLLRHFCRVRFDSVRADESQLVGTIGAAAERDRLRRLAMLVQCAEMAGAAARVLEFTIDYASDRFSFGRPLSSYQALKHRFADMKLWIEAAHAITDEAAVAMSEDGDSRGRVNVAKSYVGDRAADIIQDCVQLHGGIGVTWEHDIHLYLRRVTVNRGLFGDPAEHRAVLSTGLGI